MRKRYIPVPKCPLSESGQKWTKTLYINMSVSLLFGCDHIDHILQEVRKGLVFHAKYIYL